jgi:hypothetical protein
MSSYQLSYSMGQNGRESNVLRSGPSACIPAITAIPLLRMKEVARLLNDMTAEGVIAGHDFAKQGKKPKADHRPPER